jgi:probable F420-dependent oxidoreductase
MQIGFGLPVSGSWATPGNQVEVARRAEDLGYASLWTFQRLLSPEGPEGPVLAPPYHSVLDPLVSLAHVAGVTKRIRLGVAVVNMPFQAPAVLAKQLATLDVLSGGRLDAGLGLGWMHEEFEATGASFAARGRRGAEYIRCLRAIWSDPVVELDGEFYRVPRARIEPKPVQRPGPPILIGGTAEPALRRAGRLADGWISSSRADLAALGESVRIIRDAACGAGRDPALLRFVTRGVVRLRDGQGENRAPLTGSLAQIRGDLGRIAELGVTELFFDLNFDPEVGSPEADPGASMDRARAILEALAPA